MKTAPDIEMDMFPSLKKKIKKINVRNYAHGIKWLKKSYNEKEKEQKKKEEEEEKNKLKIWETTIFYWDNS